MLVEQNLKKIKSPGGKKINNMLNKTFALVRLLLTENARSFIIWYWRCHKISASISIVYTIPILIVSLYIFQVLGFEKMRASLCLVMVLQLSCFADTEALSCAKLCSLHQMHESTEDAARELLCLSSCQHRQAEFTWGEMKTLSASVWI